MTIPNLYLFTLVTLPFVTELDEKCSSYFLVYLANNETSFSHFLGIFEANTREYFQGVCDYFLVPATEVPEIIQLVFGMELLPIYSLSEAGSEHEACFGASLRLTKGFKAVKKSPNKVWR